MARKSHVTRITMIPDGITELLKSDEITETVRGVGDDIARDATTKSGRDDFESEIWRERRTRNVANVKFTHEHAVSIEAKNGYLGKAARKNRGWR